MQFKEACIYTSGLENSFKVFYSSGLLTCPVRYSSCLGNLCSPSVLPHKESFLCTWKVLSTCEPKLTYIIQLPTASLTRSPN